MTSFWVPGASKGEGQELETGVVEGSAHQPRDSVTQCLQGLLPCTFKVANLISIQTVILAGLTDSGNPPQMPASHS